MKRYIAILEIDDDCEIAGSIDATASYTYRENGTYYATTESVEFKAESEEKGMTREDAKAFLIDISYEYLSVKEGKKMREAIETLEQEPFINKPCVSEKVCEHDKKVVLDKIRAKIDNAIEFERKWLYDAGYISKDIDIALDAIKSVMAESEDK